MSHSSDRLRLNVRVEQWPLKEPFRITGYVMTGVDLVVVSLERDGLIGHGEAAGVYYFGDDAASMAKQLERARPEIEAGANGEALRELVPSSGARNALDCAHWDLEAKRSKSAAWQLAGLSAPKPVLTTFTCGAADPRQMSANARAYTDARAIKLKLTGDPVDADRVKAVRDARPDVWLSIDANQGFTRGSLDRLMPVLVNSNVALIEQPFPRGQESLLDGFDCPIPLAADESVQGLADIPALVGRFSVVNIKLDKCGGLTEGLAMARKARELGLSPMVGNMMGTSLAMAPAFLVGQLCDVADLDGPIFLREDRSPKVSYDGGLLVCPRELWG